MKKNSKTNKLMISVLSTATLLAACSAPVTEEVKDDPFKYGDPVSEPTTVPLKEIDVAEAPVEKQDMNAEEIKEYFDENNIEYDEEELEEVIQEYEQTGTISESSSNSSFPWYLFLLSRFGGSNHSAHSGITSTPNTSHNSNGYVNNNGQTNTYSNANTTTTEQSKTSPSINEKSNYSTNEKSNQSITNSTSNQNNTSVDSSSKSSNNVSSGYSSNKSSSSSSKSGFGGSSSHTGS